MLNKGPLQGDAWVNGRLTRTQVTSSPETSRPEVWSSMPKCAQKKAQQQWDIERPQIQPARQKRKHHDIPPDEIEEFDAMIQNARKNWGIPVGPAMPCSARIRITNSKTPTRKVAVSTICGGNSWN